MKILFVSDLYPLKNDKTIPLVVEDFALAFRDFGCDVCVLRPNFIINSIIRGHKLFKNGIYYEKNMKIYNRNYFLPCVFDKNNFLYIEEEFDLIISHMPLGHICADLLNKKLNLPHISIIHHSDYRVLNELKYSFYFKNRLKKALKKSTLIGARNRFLKEKLHADFLLPSFIEEEKIISEKKNFNKDKLKIITLSKLIKRKNIDLVIKTLKKVSFDFEYEIYGSGKEERKLKNLIIENNLQDKIKIHPHIPHNQIFEKLDKNDVFILPSITETFGVSYLEAMARGLIVIGTKNTGVDGVIENDNTGFLINPNIKEIKDILEKINFINKEEFVKNSLENVKKFQKEKIMTKYFENIKKIL